ncbi:MAG: TIGR03643 family protein [Halomonas sp.]|nr:TIGR03643 family protein [Halomonas sp.]
MEMAWEDRTPFEAIETQFGLNEADTVAVMRHTLKPTSFRRWRQRVQGRATKHKALRPDDVSRGYCPTQYKPR